MAHNTQQRHFTGSLEIQRLFKAGKDLQDHEVLPAPSSSCSFWWDDHTLTKLSLLIFPKGMNRARPVTLEGFTIIWMGLEGVFFPLCLESLSLKTRVLAAGTCGLSFCGRIPEESPLQTLCRVQSRCSKQNYRILESLSHLGWKEPSRSSRSNPFHDQGHFPLDQVNQSLTQPGLEHNWSWNDLRAFSNGHTSSSFRGLLLPHPNSQKSRRGSSEQKTPWNVGLGRKQETVSPINLPPWLFCGWDQSSPSGESPMHRSVGWGK